MILLFFFGSTPKGMIRLSCLFHKFYLYFICQFPMSFIYLYTYVCLRLWYNMIYTYNLLQFLILYSNNYLKLLFTIWQENTRMIDTVCSENISRSLFLFCIVLPVVSKWCERMLAVNFNVYTVIQLLFVYHDFSFHVQTLENFHHPRIGQSFPNALYIKRNFLNFLVI